VLVDESDGDGRIPPGFLLGDEVGRHRIDGSACQIEVLDPHALAQRFYELALCDPALREGDLPDALMRFQLLGKGRVDLLGGKSSHVDEYLPRPPAVQLPVLQFLLSRSLHRRSVTLLRAQDSPS